MKDNRTIRSAARLLVEHHRRKQWLMAVTALAGVVVFCTVYALILPAVTLEGNVYCGIEEHTHDESCYEKKLVCGEDEGETAGHVHSDDCYKTEQVLVCGKEESEGHTHSEDCYDAEGNLTCGKEESEGHTHSEDCYEEQKALICGKDEGEGATSHTHTEDCYKSVLVCDKEEHTHTLACHSNPEADVETAEKWEKSVSRARLTGDWAEDVVSVAKTQLGYTESTENYAVLEDGETMKGYTRYGAWYGDEYGDWSAMFVSFCLNYAEISAKYVPQSGDCEDWVVMLSDKDYDLYQKAGDYTPVPGDLVFLDTDKDGKAELAGIVSECVKEDGESDSSAKLKEIRLIAGDAEDKVQTLTYDADDSELLGYAALPENPNAEPDTDPADTSIDPADSSTDGSTSAPAGQSTVSTVVDGVTFTATGALPEDARLVVKQLTDDQITYIGETFEKAALGETTYAYDIKLVDADGAELELGESVHITVAGLDFPEGTNVTGYHLADVDEDTLEEADAASVDVEQVDVTADETGLSYDADGFSVTMFTVKRANAAANSIDSFAISFVSGATEQEDGSYLWSPTDKASGHSFAYRMNYTLEGSSFSAGSIKITLPLHILKGRDNKWADCFDCPYVLESELKAGDNPTFIYTIDEENNTVTITNYQEMTSGSSGYIEFAYVTTEETLNYADMTKSDSVSVELEAGDASETATAPGVTVDTHVTINYTSKESPTYYEEWQAEWGTEPEDASNWYYLVYPIYSYINKNTQPYTFSLTDTFTDMGGKVVAYRLDGQNGWTSWDGTKPVTTETLTEDGQRYDYVLVRYSAAQAKAAVDSDRTYSVRNTVTATVTPLDGKDDATTATSSKTWSYQIPNYKLPGESFRMEKWGLYGNYNQVKNSQNVSTYQLAEYLSGTADTLGGLKYKATIYAHLYPYTVENGYTLTGTSADAEHYAKKPVTYVLQDNTFQIKPMSYATTTGVSSYGQALARGDYELSSLEWSLDVIAAEFDETTQKYTGSVTTYLFNDKMNGRVAEKGYTENTVYFYAQIGNSTEWTEVAEYNLETSKYTVKNDCVESAPEGVRTLTFRKNANVTGYKIVTSNAYYYDCLTALPTVSLKRTEHLAQILTGKSSATVNELKDLEGDLTKLAVINTASGKATQGGKELKTDSDYAEVYAAGVERHSSLTNSVAATSNDKTNKQYTITWNSKLSETYTDDEGTNYVPQEGGTFYTLLPEGAVLDTGSIVVKNDVDVSSSGSGSGTALSSGEYTCEVIENYENTGRQMLIVTVKESTEKGYALYYDTVFSWDAIQDHAKTVTNVVAYETGNTDIVEGQPDNGTLGVQLTKDDDEDDQDTTAKFLYNTDASFDINILLAANTGLTKQVRAAGDTGYTSSTTVYSAGPYSYLLRYANDTSTTSSHIILMDSIENYVKNGTASNWRGTLTGISTSQLTEKGIDPTVYVSTVENLDLTKYWNANTKTYDLSDTEVWQKLTDSTDLSTVHAVAIDCGKAANGGDFTLGAGESLSATLFMSAPAPKAVNSALDNPVTYNNVYAVRAASSTESSGTTGEVELIHQDNTEVFYRVVGDVKLTKVNAEDNTEVVKGVTYRLSGTSHYGTAYDETTVSDRNGEMTFENIERGDYELVETRCGSDWQLNTEIYQVSIDAEGNVTVTGREDVKQDEDGNRYLIPDQPRAHGDLKLSKVDSVSGNPVEGAEFKLSGTSEYDNQVTQLVTSDEDGELNFYDLECGTYTLIEVSAPEGYIRNETQWTVEVDENSLVTLYEQGEDGELTPVETDESGALKITDEPLHDVTFVKTSTYGTNVRISGVEFTLTGTSDYGTVYDGICAVSSDDLDGGTFGYVTFTGLEPGTYTLRETSTENAKDNSGLNDGAGLTYTPDSKTCTVVVKADGTFTISGLTKLQLDTGKTDEETGEKINTEVYNFPNTPESGVVKVTKLWLDDGETEKDPTSALAVTISTALPDPGSYGGKTVTFQAGSGAFSDSKTNSVVYLSSGAVVSGTYQQPTSSSGAFKGWVDSSGKDVTVDSNGWPTGYSWGSSTTLTLTAQYETVNMKYAVRLYGIEADKDAEGNTLGLTFGPATGEDYRGINQTDGTAKVEYGKASTQGYVAHVSKDSGEKCLHWMTWEEISQEASKDPHIFDDCLAAGCTHSVNVALNSTLLNSSFAQDVSTWKGDGAGGFSQSLNNEFLQWNGEYQVQQYNNGHLFGYNYGGWSFSRVRNTLNGGGHYSIFAYPSDKDTVINGDNSLLSCFESGLRKNIQAASKLSDTGWNNGSTDKTQDTKDYPTVNNEYYKAEGETTVDKLWLFSAKELGKTAASESSLSGITTYTWPTKNGISLKNYCERDAGEYGNSWGLRTTKSDTRNKVYTVTMRGAFDDINSPIQTYRELTIAPGFCLGVVDSNTTTASEAADDDDKGVSARSDSNDLMTAAADTDPADSDVDEGVSAQSDDGSTEASGTATYTTTKGEWKTISEVKDATTGLTTTTYGKDTDGDGVYDITLVCTGSQWDYYFTVADENAEYYVTEQLADNLTGYTLKDAEGKEIAYATMTNGEATLYNVSEGYGLPDYGGLTIEKKVAGGEDSSSFPFTVTLSYTPTGSETVDITPLLTGAQTYGGMTFTWSHDGDTYTATAVTYLKDGDKVSLSDIPAGVSYEVTENTPSGYTASWSEGASRTGTITAESTPAVYCLNTREEEPDPGPDPEVKTGSFAVKKTVQYEDGRLATEDATAFSFRAVLGGLTAGSSYSYTVADGESQTYTALADGSAVVRFQLTNGQSALFEGLPVGATYQVTESAAEGYTAAYAVTNFTDVTRSAGSSAEANTALSTGVETLDEGEATDTNTVRISFTNTTPAPTPEDETVSLTVNKVWGDGDEVDHSGDIVTIQLKKAATQEEVENDYGTIDRTLTLSAANDWTAEVTDLPRYTGETDENGEAEEWIYYIREETFDGYKATITEEKTEEEHHYSYTVTNYRAADLPMTGGIGTAPYILSGALLTAAALGYSILRRRKGDEVR